MKNYIWFILALLLLSDVTATDYQAVHREHILKTRKLEQVVKEVFTFSNNPCQGPAFSPADFLVEERVNKRIEMDMLFSLSVDLSITMSALSTYGLNKVGAKAHTIDLQKYPQWATASDVFYYLSMPQYFKAAKNDLRKMGLSSEDFTIIDEYIHSNNIHILNDEIILQSLAPIETRIRQLIFDNNQAAIALNYSSKLIKQTELNWYLWAQELLSQFPQSKQQALIDYGTKDLGFTYIIATDINETNLSYLAKRIQSGTYREQVTSRINSLKSKLARERTREGQT